MKKCTTFLVVLVMCLLLCACSSSPEPDEPNRTEESAPVEETANNTVDVETTQLYKDFFEPYTDSIGSLNSVGFATVEKLNDYRVEYTPGTEEDLCVYKIYDDNDDYIYMVFYPENINAPSDEWVETLSLLAYESNGYEISVLDNYHNNSSPVYHTYDPNREPANQDANNVNELVSFMFGKK